MNSSQKRRLRVAQLIAAMALITASAFAVNTWTRMHISTGNNKVASTDNPSIQFELEGGPDHVRVRMLEQTAAYTGLSRELEEGSHDFFLRNFPLRGTDTDLYLQTCEGSSCETGGGSGTSIRTGWRLDPDMKVVGVRFFNTRWTSTFLEESATNVGTEDGREYVDPRWRHVEIDGAEREAHHADYIAAHGCGSDRYWQFRRIGGGTITKHNNDNCTWIRDLDENEEALPQLESCWGEDGEDAVNYYEEQLDEAGSGHEEELSVIWVEQVSRFSGEMNEIPQWDQGSLGFARQDTTLVVVQNRLMQSKATVASTIAHEWGHTIGFTHVDQTASGGAEHQNDHTQYSSRCSGSGTNRNFMCRFADSERGGMEMGEEQCEDSYSDSRYRNHAW